MKWFLYILVSLVAATAIPSGLLLIAEPGGSYLDLYGSLLQTTPFANYLVPGLILLILVGGTNLLAVFMLMTNNRNSYRFTLIAGMALLSWLTGQMFIVPYYTLMQALLIVVGILIVLISYKLSGKLVI